MSYYVVTAPETHRRICETWDECRTAVEGLKGARYQKVQDLKQAEALFSGKGVVLPAGLHVFTDGNDSGGVGVVVVWMGEDQSADPVAVTEIATSVGRVFYGGLIPQLGTDDEVAAALDESRNVLAELAGLFLALWQAPSERQLTIVHDYEGVAAWMEGRWRFRNRTIEDVVSECRRLAEVKGLDLKFVWQKGHTSTWAGRNDPARFNNRADELATLGSA